MSRVIFVVLMVMSVLPVVPASGQQPGFARSNAKVIVLADGRLAVIKPGPSGPVVEGMVDGDRLVSKTVDLQAGDIILRFQNIAAPTADQIEAAFDAAPVGTELTLAVRRGGTERVVSFLRPATPGGSRIAVAAPSGTGAGAWVTGAPSGNANFTIAGTHFRENEQGLPEVSHRTSHPAGVAVALRTGDVVAAFNGRPVAALAGLELWYGQVPPGGEIVLSIVRTGQTVTVKFAKPADQ